MNKPIGIFDSGVGGLTVLSAFQELLPNEDFIYIGDNKNCPYGDKSKEELLICAKDIINYFILKDVKMVVLACNTTSANILEELKFLYPNLLLVGVINPTVDFFIKSCFKKVLVIATVATINSGSYKDKIKKSDNSIKVYQKATPKLVPLIEGGADNSVIDLVIKEYLEEYKDKVDSIILGCTHYPIIFKQLNRLYPNIELLSSSTAIIQTVKKILMANNIVNTKEKGEITIYTTGKIEEFYNSSSKFFDYQGLKVKQLKI